MQKKSHPNDKPQAYIGINGFKALPCHDNVLATAKESNSILKNSLINAKGCSI